jgi:hypothetical protein
MTSGSIKITAASLKTFIYKFFRRKLDERKKKNNSTALNERLTKFIFWKAEPISSKSMTNINKNLSHL